MENKYFYDKGVLHSVWPPEAHFGFSYWSLMICPFPPENVLILGYGQGGISNLIHKIWREDLEHYDPHVVGVDKEQVDNPYTPAAQGDDFFQIDAFKFVEKYEQRFDYVIIDLFNGAEIPEEVWGKEFADNLARITKKMLCINTLGRGDLTELSRYFRLILTKRWYDNSIHFLVPHGSKENYFPPNRI